MESTYRKFEPNVSSGLVLPVVVETPDGPVINMQLVPSHHVVTCGEVTDEMAKWLETGYLLEVTEENS